MDTFRQCWGRHVLMVALLGTFAAVVSLGLCKGMLTRDLTQASFNMESLLKEPSCETNVLRRTQRFCEAQVT